MAHIADIKVLQTQINTERTHLQQVRRVLDFAYEDIRIVQRRQNQLQGAVMLIVAAAAVYTGVAAYRWTRLRWRRNKRNGAPTGSNTDKVEHGQ